MAKHLTLDLRHFRPERGRGAHASRAARLMLVMFTLGVLAGSVAGTYFTAGGVGPDYADAGRYAAAEALPGSLPLALWNSARFFLVLALAATSWLGVLLVPAAALVRGYLLSCSAAALYASFGWTGLRCALLVSGLPALLLVPAFLAAASAALSASRWLLERRFGLAPVLPGRQGPGKRVLAFALPIIAEALYSFYLLPRLLAGM